MNERIRELAIEAGAKVIGDQFRYMKMYEDDIEKFAELIVQECATVITETRWHLPPTQQQIAIGIKKHFGVK